MRLVKSIRGLSARRALGAAYGLVMAFVLAHSVNAFVSYSIEKPSHEPVASSNSPQTLAEPTDPKALAKTILSGSLFALPPNAEGFLTNGKISAPPPPLEVAKKLALIGTVMNTSSGGLAILEDLASKKQTLFHLDEKVPGIGIIADVQKDKILFRQDTQEEWLPLELAKSGPQAPLLKLPVAVPVRSKARRDVRMIDRRELGQLMADVPRLLQHAQVVPQFTEGRFDGFRLEQVNFYGFFGKMGLQSGDLLKRINGVEIRDPGLLISALKHLTNERSLKLDIVRGNTPLTFPYEIR